MNQKLIYSESPKHHQNVAGYVTGSPVNGQKVLDNSLPISENSSRRISVDYEQMEFVTFDETHPGSGIFHGYVRPWSRMTSVMRKVVIDSGLATRKGKIKKTQ